MRILWLSWKDHEHPLAGGAELVLRELSQRLVRDGHDVTVLTTGYDGARTIDMVDNVFFIRIGRSRYVHSFKALAYYLRRLRGKFDVVIEVVNTAPYFSTLFGGGARTYLFYHQLAREIWFYETGFPLSHMGFHVLEPLSSRLLARAKPKVITVSDSTKQDLVRHGFAPNNISVISEGIETEPVDRLETIEKFSRPTVLSLGAIRRMKRTLDQVKAFEQAKHRLTNLQLVIAGDNTGPYGREVMSYAAASPHAADIHILGRVSTAQKFDLMRRAHALTVTSIKEGWGLVVSEAASQGTPAIVYDADGLRDSVQHLQTGLILPPSPQALSQGIVRLLTDRALYQNVRRQAWEWSKQLTFDQSYNDFKQVVFA